MEKELTLPGLQSELELLREGERMTLSRSDADTLFGSDETGHLRLVHFAKGHSCVAIRTPRGVTFFKERRQPA